MGGRNVDLDAANKMANSMFLSLWNTSPFHIQYKEFLTMVKNDPALNEQIARQTIIDDYRIHVVEKTLKGPGYVLPYEAQLDADQLAKQLKKAIDTGEVTVEMLGENVVINFPEEKTSDEDISTMIAETLEALNEARENAGAGASEQEVLFGGIEGELEKLAASMNEASPKNGEGPGGSSQEAYQKQQNASRTTEELTTALKQQIDQGLVEVEQRDDKVFITVGSGGAFPSGTADLTEEAQRILDRISLAAMSPKSTITVTGHTDDVPIKNAQFRDNWDLAAGRASSVVQAIQRTGLIDGDRLSAVSKGETAPLADNATAAGRSENRRIEIEITY